MASEFENERASRDTSTNSIPDEHSKVKSLCNVEAGSDFVMEADMDCCGSKEFPMKSSSSSYIEEKHDSKVESEDVELGGFFLEDAPSNDGLSPEILKLQAREKIRKLFDEKNFKKLDGIWKKVIS